MPEFTGFKYRFEDVTKDSIVQTHLQLSDYDNFYNALFSVFGIKRDDFKNEKYLVFLNQHLTTNIVKLITILPKLNPVDESVPILFSDKSITIYQCLFSSYEHYYPNYNTLYDADVKAIFDYLSTY